jgi:hypothetical protein
MSEITSTIGVKIGSDAYFFFFLGIEAAPIFYFFVPTASESELVLALFPLDTSGAAATATMLTPDSLA